MGKIRTDMEKLANQVRTSAAARHAGVKHVREAAHGLLAQDQGERRERARKIVAQASELGAKLERQSSERLKSARELKSGLGRKADQRRAAIREGHGRTSAHLSELRLGRQRMARELRQSAQQEVDGIRTAVGVLRSNVRTTMSGIASDVAEATRLWRSGPSRLPVRPKRGR